MMRPARSLSQGCEPMSSAVIVDACESSRGSRAASSIQWASSAATSGVVAGRPRRRGGGVRWIPDSDHFVN